MTLFDLATEQSPSRDTNRLSASQLPRNFLACRVIRRFSTVFTTACRQAVSWLTRIHSILFEIHPLLSPHCLMALSNENRADEPLARVPKMTRWRFPWHAAFTAVHLFILFVNNIFTQIGAVRSVDWIFIVGALDWRCLGKYVTLDRTFYSLLLKREAVAAQLLPHFVAYRIPGVGLN